MIVITNIRHAESPIRASLAEAGCTLYDYGQVEAVNKLNTDRVLLFSGMADYDRGHITDAANKLRRDIQIGWWLGDLRDPREHFWRFELDNINHLFVPSYNWLQEYRSYVPLTHYMPQSGFCYDILKHRYKSCRGLNSIFIGGVGKRNDQNSWWHANRPDILETINKCCNLGIIKGEQNTYSQSYLYKHIPFSVSITWPDAVCYSSNRLYNILAAGGLALQNHVHYIERLVTNKEHVLVYKDVKEIPDIIDHYLNNPHLIERFKKNARKLFLEKHTGKCRVKNITDIMDSKTDKFYGYVS